MQQFINFEETDTGKQVKFIDSRYYTKDNKTWYPGITTILNVLSKGKQYEDWLKSNGFNADYIARQAMEQGSQVHELIQRLLLGEEVIFGTIEQGAFYTRDVWAMVSKFIDFYTEFKPKTIAIEKVLVSDVLRFGSQLDYVCLLNGERWVIDHKTGSLYETAYLQIASYVQLWNEYFPKEPIQKAGILHLGSSHKGRDKSGKEIQGYGWKLIEVADIEKQWQDFLHVQALWERSNPDYKPFNVIYPSSYKLQENE